ncbi:MAG: hypothetical protein ACLFVU_02465 [Phycisphaerae bacterium]
MTLLEVVMAIAILTAMMSLLFYLYRQTVRVRQMAMDRGEALRHRRLVMDRIAGDLRTTLPQPLFESDLARDESEIQLVVARLPGPAVWARAMQSETDAGQIPPEHDLQIIGYKTLVCEDTGLSCGIVRTQQKLVLSQAAEVGVDIREEVITTEYRFLRFSYWNGTDWSPQWQESGLPMAVRVQLGKEPIPEDVSPEEYPYPLVQREIFVPGGSGSMNSSVYRPQTGQVLP